MKNKFSFSRIGLMLRADWIEYKKAFLIFAGLLVGGNLFLLLNARSGFQLFLFIAGVFSTLTAFYMFTGWKAFRQKNRLLTLPATTFEKFVEIKTVGFLLFCVYFLIYATMLGIMHLKSGAQIWFFSGNEWFNSGNNTNGDSMPYYMGFLMGAGLLLFICTFLFMCCIAFRKYSLGKGTLILFAIAMVFSYSTYLFFKIDGFNINDGNSFQNGFVRSNAMLETMHFLSTYFAPCMLIASVVLMYVSYLKLQEKQIR